jgi:hypothetical protein
MNTGLGQQGEHCTSETTRSSVGERDEVKVSRNLVCGADGITLATGEAKRNL